MYCSSEALVLPSDESAYDERGQMFREDTAMLSSVNEMLAEANAAVPRLDPGEVRNRMSRGDVLIVDVRDTPELAAGGKLKGGRPRLARHAGIPRRSGEPLPQSGFSKR
jgi:hypothetical protein